MTDTHYFLNKVFSDARTANGFTDRQVAHELLRRIYDIARMGPISMNTQPARYVFLTTQTAKDRLFPTLSTGNLDKSRQAPVIVIVAVDTQFHEFMPTLFPHRPDAKEIFQNNAALTTETASRNGTLSSAYFLIVARALGLDCGPMSGFDASKVNEEFFPDGRWQVNYLINLGYGDPIRLFDRQPRLSFEQAARVL